MMRTQGVWHTGSAVLGPLLHACGRADALWEFGPRPWDVAAGALIVPSRAAVLRTSTVRTGPQRAQDPCGQRQAASRDTRDDREGVARGASVPSRRPRGPVTHPSLSAANH